MWTTELTSAVLGFIMVCAFVLAVITAWAGQERFYEWLDERAAARRPTVELEPVTLSRYQQRKLDAWTRENVTIQHKHRWAYSPKGWVRTCTIPGCGEKQERRMGTGLDASFQDDVLEMVDEVNRLGRGARAN